VTTIVVQNQTASDLNLRQLSAIDGIIPASGSANLSDYNGRTEIYEDSQLRGYIESDDVLIEVNSVLLTKEQSLSFLDWDSGPKSNMSATNAPGVNDDSTQGYSVGSLWVDTVGSVAYTCTDASVGSAVWLAQGGELPPATQIGQILYSVNGTSFSIEQPLISLGGGWLASEDGILLIVG